MRYLLDTNAVIGLLNDPASTLARTARNYDPRELATSSIVAHELYFGAFKSGHQAHNLSRLEAIRLAVLPFEREDARQAGEIRAGLAARGKPIGPYDLLIAGQARARDLILVSNNVREFSRVEGLRVEDWSR